MQVPRQLAALCCQFQLSSSGSSWWQAWTLVHVLLLTAAHDIVLGRNMAVENDSTVLERCIRQQFQQANLFEHCTVTMLAAAQLLQAEGAAAAATAAATGDAAAAPPAQTPSAQGIGSSGSQSSGSTSAMGGSSKVSYTCCTLMKVGSALLPLQELNSVGWCRMVEATAELAAAAVLFLNDVTRRARSGDLLDPRVPETTARILFNVMLMLQHADSTSKQLLQSPAVNRALTLAMLVVHAQSLLPVKLQQRPADRPRSSGNAGSSSDSGSGVADRGLLEGLVRLQLPEGCATRKHALRAWKAAQKLEAPLQQTMLQTLGISLQAVGWVAGNIPRESRPLEDTAQAVDAVSHCGWVFKQLSEGLQQAVYTPEELGSIIQQEVMPALLQQLPQRVQLVQLLLVALQRRYEQQAGIAAAPAAAATAWVAECRTVVTAASAAIGCAWRDWDLQCDMLAETSEQLAAAARQQGAQQFRATLAGWMSGGISVLLKILSAVLQEAEAVPAAAATPPAAAVAGSSSGGSSSSSTQQVTKALQDCVLLLTTMGRQDFFVLDEFSLEVLSEGAAVSCAGDPAFLKPWIEHSAAICTALEGVWRVHVRLGACGGNVGDRKEWVLENSIQLPNVLGQGGALLLAVEQAGHGSIEQRQLLSMLCSLLKLCRTLGDKQSADECVWRVVQSTALSLVHDRGSDHWQQPPIAGGAAAAAAAAAGDATIAPPAAAAAAASQQQPGAEGHLPWLVLLGRCFLYHGEQLLQLQQHTPNIGERLQALAGDNVSPIGTVFPGLYDFHPAAFLYDGTTWVGLFDQCKQGLTKDEGVGSLAAAGYPIQSAMQHAYTAKAALHALVAAGNAGAAAAAAAAYTDFTQQLQALGGVLSTLPVPCACNNPGCTNMLGPTELASVSGRSCICSGCVVARYCGRVCQRACWKQHKPVCKALAAAAAASGK